MNEGLFDVAPPQPDERGVVAVETDAGVKFAFRLTEKEEMENSLWGLTHIWKPLTSEASVAKLREVRRGWRF